MAKYYYNKYKVITSHSYRETFKYSGYSRGTLLKAYPDYTFDENKGIFSIKGKSVDISADETYGTYYIIADDNGAIGGTSGPQIFKYKSDGIEFNGERYYARRIINYSKGDFVSELIAEDGTYPNDGRHTDGYWYVKGDLANSPPTISGQDQNLGDKNLGFVISYQVDDVDAADNLIVTEKLNGSTIRTINGAPRNENLEIEITNETLFSLPLDSTNTIEIKVDDGQGGIAYRRYTFRRTNTAPIISGEDEDLGQKIEPFSIDFTVSDNEGNAITVKTYLDGLKKEEYQAEDGATNTFTISQEDWFKLPIGQHSIKFEATDEHGATAIRNYTVERYDDKIQFTLKNPIETDIMASKILVTPTWTIPEGAIGKVEACNNGFDEVPTWEDITSQILINRHYNFTNATKTAEKWGINIRFTIEKGTAAEECVINGFGGAFE